MPVELITSNRAIENAAIAWVMEFERLAGRDPQDTRHVASAAADIVSLPRLIEVKAYGASARGGDLWLETPQMKAALENMDFFLYVVENVRQGDPAHFTLKILAGEQLQQRLAMAKERRYFLVPWPTKDYDATPVASATAKP